MKSNSAFFNTLLLAAPVALCLQASALAQPDGATNTPPPPAQAASAPEQKAQIINEARAILQQRVDAAGAPEPTAQNNVEFFFPGGTPNEFVSAIEKQYKVDWRKVADIPENMHSVHIPALRMDRQSVETMFPVFRGGGGGGRGGGGGGGGGGQFGGVGRRGGFFGDVQEDRNPLSALIALYNSLQQAKPELGNLMVEGDLAKPSVVIFHSSFSPPIQPTRKVKAFSLIGIPDNEAEKLKAEIIEQCNEEIMLQRQLAERTGVPQPIVGADVSHHKDTGLLVVSGPEWSVDAAESFVTAWKANHPNRYATPPTDLPGQK